MYPEYINSAGEDSTQGIHGNHLHSQKSVIASFFYCNHCLIYCLYRNLIICTTVYIIHTSINTRMFMGKPYWGKKLIEVDDVVYELCRYNGLSLMMCFQHFQSGDYQGKN